MTKPGDSENITKSQQVGGLSDRCLEICICKVYCPEFIYCSYFNPYDSVMYILYSSSLFYEVYSY